MGGAPVLGSMTVTASTARGSLDVENADALFELIDELNESGAMFLVVTHPRLVWRCDRIIIEPFDGRIVAGKPNLRVVRRG